MRDTWLKKKFTQLAPYPPRSPNKGDRISGAEPSAYLPGDTSGYSPRLSIVAKVIWVHSHGTEYCEAQNQDTVHHRQLSFSALGSPVTQTCRLPRAG